MKNLSAASAIIVFIFALASGVSGNFAPDMLSLFFNPPAVVFVFLLSALITLSYHTSQQVINAFRVHTLISSQSRDALKDSVFVLDSMRAITLTSGVVGFLIGMMTLLANMEDPRQISRSMGTSLLSVLYAVIIAEWIIHPRQRIAARALLFMSDEVDKEVLSTPAYAYVAFTVVMFILFIFFIMLFGFTL